MTGINNEGKILLNDPYRPNYEKDVIKNGFINGFEEKQIMKGFSGAWIIEPKEEYLIRNN